MRRVVCLLLCAVLLLSLLPAALADGEQPMYFEVCSSDGSVSEEQSGRGSQLHMGYGVTVYFRVYTDRTGGEAITGDQLHLYENNEDVTKGMLTWMDGYYAWDTRWVKTANPVFLASVGYQEYEGITQVHEAEVGWFSSRDKSLSAALTYGGETYANVYYDGTKDVTVYLTADFSFTTNITLSEIKKTNNDIQLELEPRGSFGERDLGYRLKVTCPADLLGELTVTVPVDLCFHSEDGDEEWRNTYIVTFSKDGKKLDVGEQRQPGEPTAIKVKIKDKEGNAKEKTCWFGVGEFANNKYNILSASSMGNTADSPNFAMLAVGLWWKDEHKDGSWDLTMLSKKEAEQVMEQAEFHLEFHAQSGQKATPEGKTPDEIKETYSYRDLIEAVDAAAALGMPASACYPLEAQHEGTWRVEAVCEMNEKTYTAYGNLERRVTNVINLNGCTTVEEVNAELGKTFKNLPDSSKRRETNIRVWLKAQEYTGQIVVPDIPDGCMEVGVEFIGDIWSGNGTPVVELHGGICSNSAPIAVQNISFIGAGKQEPAEDGTIKYWENWPEGTANYGAENSAIYGNSMATAGSCKFTGYYYAMKLTKEMRLCGRDNNYVENHIAWYLGQGNNNGGNPAANNCVFEQNDIAIQIEKFNLRPSFYAPSGCEFIDNKLDIKNNSGRAWFIPGNYFVHGTDEAGNDILKTMISPGTSVSCYPMRRGDQFYFNYEQGATNYLLSNSLTSAYPTPQAYLDGKTFEVVDEETEQTLAAFSFDSPEQQTIRLAVQSAGQEKAFDATVRVDRSDELRIAFTMNDPCKLVTVTLPCTFKTGTVTLDGAVIENARFDGEAVSFETSEGGTYLISYTPPIDPLPEGRVIVAGYDKDGRLLAVRILPESEASADIPGAAAVKRFRFDRAYRPI